ncbi:cilia- and flagella-associated protein 97 isoform X2 [Epinephelus fuscoguttatus]|uniref:cilia- and flagella-associated protein 97 isoform X2 n=1 Tax=Epinephelus fuscoguttatus TaxID=293821 RepID=UPI0020D19299|nr:cilia- and flagella-associated protein 97 isoform X2 [Epinephelus fuscoguttatus]
MSAMFSPGELEGEVDHSFFDSDCDERSVSKDGGGKERLPPHESLLAKQTENTKGGLSPRTDGPKKHVTAADNNSSSRAERKKDICQSKEEDRSRVSGVSVACASEKVISNSSDSEADSNMHSNRSKGTLMALLTEAREFDYKDVYSQSPNESEEETPPSKHSGSKGRNKQSPKKLIRSRRTRTPSPTSTESSVDADSEHSCSSSNGRGSCDSPVFHRANKPPSPGVRRTRVGSTGSQEGPIGRTEESEDTVTDVSPLSSSDFSPLQSLDLNNTEAEEGSLKEQQQQQQQQQQERVPSSGLSSIHQDEDSDQDVDDCSLSSESQLGGKLVLRYPGGRNRKNYSFTNDEVRRIDRENQRLLRELSRHSPGPRPGSTARKKPHVASKSPHNRLSHSALNRQREQQRIERENLAFLKRLESVKPTPGLKRSEQLEDYQRHMGYLGAPSYTVCMSTTNKERPSSKTPSGPRPASSAHHSSRAVSSTSDSGKTPAPRSKKLSAPRPAWC